MTVEEDNRSGLRLAGKPSIRNRLNVVQRARPMVSWRFAIFIIVGIFLVWEVLTRSFGAYFADSSPEIAIGLWSSNPKALINLALANLDRDTSSKGVETIDAPLQGKPDNETSVSKGIKSDPINNSHYLTTFDAALDIAQTRSWAEQALYNDPLNASAFRILGQLSQRGSDEERTKTFMEAAVRRSLMESRAIYWMMRKNYQDGDYRSAIRYADVLLRTQPGFPQLAMPLLGKIAETPNTSGELMRLLANNPPWRSAFQENILWYISDARTPLELLLSLKHTAAPPTPREINSYLNFLIDRGFPDLAYYAWLQFLPPDQLSKVSRLFNGSFEMDPGGSPFDWVFDGGPGLTIQIAERPDPHSGHGLFVEFGSGRIENLNVTQILILPPGTYQFQGQYKVDMVSQRGLQWRLTCAKASTPLGQSETVNGTQPTWKDFEFSFAVPDTDCPAQYLRLALDARSASERFVSGSIWYDNLQITMSP